MTIPYTPQQLADALAALKTQPGVSVIPKSDHDGDVTTPKADFYYNFNGTQLMTSITKKHGDIRFIPDAVVYAHIHEDLMKVT